MRTNWIEFKPHVRRNVLILIAGLVWTAVGTMLSTRAVIWFDHYTGSFLVLYLIISLALGLVKGYFIFTKVVVKNISRIAGLKEASFVGAFISLKTYILITGMMIMGYLLRHSELPRQYLGVIYLGVGLAMIISSIPYFKTLVNGNLEKYRMEKA